ncbi:hypothetical protein ACFYXF_04435 [Streptomyces sp. NPDC002680]|uniref:hypothetical protein n=1 Tax=Streptomyces sp. NPDC002680 TaxID=3364659 RepID=UPI0036BD3F74
MTTKQPGAGALGAAILAGVGDGEFGSIQVRHRRSHRFSAHRAFLAMAELLP